MRRNGFSEVRDPILKPLDSIECRDAILAEDDTEPAWPEVDVVIGNPPFLGGKLLITHLGEDYVSRMFRTYAGRVPAEADLVCYWFEKAGRQIAAGRARRAGLVATNCIRGGANRRALEAAMNKCRRRGDGGRSGALMVREGRPTDRQDQSQALKKRTLTNLYNARPQWLADAHAALDAAVAAACGWPADIDDDDALRELLALNGG